MQRNHITLMLGAAAVLCTAGLASIASAQSDPEPKRKSVLRLQTKEGVVKAQIVTGELVQDLLISEVELVDVKGQLTGKLGLDQSGTLRLIATPRILPKVRLGLTTEIVPESLAIHLDMRPVDGLLVTSLDKGLPAAKGGLMRYDVLVKLEGEAPVTQQSLRQRVLVCKPGDLIKLSVVRKGQPLEVVVVAEEKDPGRNTVISWTVDSTRRYVTGIERGAFEIVSTPDESATGQYRWTLGKDGAGIAQYKIIASDRLPVEMATKIISTRQAEGGLLLNVPRMVQLRRTTLPLQVGLPLDSGDEMETVEVQVAIVDKDDLVGNIKAQIAAVKQQLAALEALVDQLDAPRD